MNEEIFGVVQKPESDPQFANQFEINLVRAVRFRTRTTDKKLPDGQF